MKKIYLRAVPKFFTLKKKNNVAVNEKFFISWIIIWLLKINSISML